MKSVNSREKLLCSKRGGASLVMYSRRAKMDMGFGLGGG